MKYPDRTTDLTQLSLTYLLMLRTIAFWGHVIVIGFLTNKIDQSLPYFHILAVLLGLGFFTLISWYWVKRWPAVSERFVFIQLLIDIFALTLLLYFTGGSANPFVSLYLLPVTVAAAMLKPLYIWFLAGIAALSYTVLMYYYQPLMIWEHHGQGFALHVWGMWCGFLLSAGLVAYFVSRIGATLRARDHALAHAKEKTLESEKLMALGSLAAGTAHELGTPLSTIAILARELEKNTPAETKTSHKLKLLQSQIKRCKQILSRMAASAGQAQADAGKQVSVTDFLQEILDEWLLSRPEVTVETDFEGVTPAPVIVSDRTVIQAIINILNNAADASTSLVSIEARWGEDALQLNIHDQGQGLSEQIVKQLGEPFVTTKLSGKGLGLGFYLAKSTLNRLGGDVELVNRDEQGATAKINLPLISLSAGQETVI